MTIFVSSSARDLRHQRMSTVCAAVDILRFALLKVRCAVIGMSGKADLTRDRSAMVTSVGAPVERPRRQTGEADRG
ncbi:hypothetical protein [Dactylosporangium sp. NPDC051541]|uniref:hypothetical protein n=1 Tax=Dactylosporangium sp. NPDC051541 TaxID=3363977 RepID=UPI0037B04AAC